MRRGVGTIVLDVRRGDGPKPCFNYTAATIATTDALIARTPEQAAAAVRAIVKTQEALKADVARAAEVGEKLFPPSEAALITDLIRRDLPYYDAALSPAFVAGMTEFARRARHPRTASALRARRRDAICAAVERLTREKRLRPGPHGRASIGFDNDRAKNLIRSGSANNPRSVMLGQRLSQNAIE